MLRLLTLQALRRGVLGGSKPWLVVGVAVVGFRIARVAVVGRSERIFRHEVQPGETLRLVARREP